MPSTVRGELVLLCLLIVLGGLAEIAAIVGVLPFLSLLIESEGSAATAGIVRALAGLGAASHAQQVVLAGALFMLLALFAGIVRLALAKASQRWSFGVGHAMSVDVERRLLSQPYAFHIEHNSSTLLAAIEKAHVISLGVLLQLTYAITAAWAALLILAVLFWIDPAAALVASLGFGSAYLLVSRFAAHRLARNSDESSRAYNERLKIAQESFGGIRDIILDDSRAMHLKAFRDADRRFTTATASTVFIGAAPRYGIETAASILIAGLALLLWRQSGSFSTVLPVLGAMALGGFRLIPYLQQLYFSWTAIAGNRTIVREVVDMLALPVADSATVNGQLGQAKAIRFESVTFQFPNAGRPALDDVSLIIPAGSKVALVGKSGSGKSTLADLAMALLQPSSGRVLIDGRSLEDVRTARAWQNSIAHVPQAIFLADTSIAENIAFGAEAVDYDRVTAVANAAGLDDLVADLPDGFQTRIGERGVRLSGGQRQRLGLARALYKDAPVLVLDEATSALDPETEEALMRRLFELGARRTILMISHRSSAIDLCDIVVTLDRGRIVSTKARSDGIRARAKA